MAQFYHPTTSCSLLSWEGLLKRCWKPLIKKKKKKALANIHMVLGKERERRRGKGEEQKRHRNEKETIHCAVGLLNVMFPEVVVSKP